MKRLFILITIAIGLSSCTESEYHEVEDSSTHISVGDSLPHFSVNDNSGNCVSDKTLRGKVAIIVFFNTDCPDCQKELPVINIVYKAYQNNTNTAFIAISREEMTNDVDAFWKDHAITIPYSAHNDRSVYNLFASSVIPRIYIANKKGIVTFISSDQNMPDDATLTDAIKNDL